MGVKRGLSTLENSVETFREQKDEQNVWKSEENGTNYIESTP